MRFIRRRTGTGSCALRARGLRQGCPPVGLHPWAAHEEPAAAPGPRGGARRGAAQAPIHASVLRRADPGPRLQRLWNGGTEAARAPGRPARPRTGQGTAHVALDAPARPAERRMPLALGRKCQGPSLRTAEWCAFGPRLPTPPRPPVPRGVPALAPVPRAPMARPPPEERQGAGGRQGGRSAPRSQNSELCSEHRVEPHGHGEDAHRHRARCTAIRPRAGASTPPPAPRGTRPGPSTNTRTSALEEDAHLLAQPG